MSAHTPLQRILKMRLFKIGVASFSVSNAKSKFWFYNIHNYMSVLKRKWFFEPSYVLYFYFSFEYKDLSLRWCPSCSSHLTTLPKQGILNTIIIIKSYFFHFSEVPENCFRFYLKLTILANFWCCDFRPGLIPVYIH